MAQDLGKEKYVREEMLLAREEVLNFLTLTLTQTLTLTLTLTMTMTMTQR